jgi:hypothetical protein
MFTRTTTLAILFSAAGIAAVAQDKGTGNAHRTLVAREESSAPAPVASTATVTMPASKAVSAASKTGVQGIQMEQRGNLLAFFNLDYMNALKVHVTNPEGREEMQSSISTSGNAVNVEGLSKGLHFITIVDGDSDARKGFMVNL